MKSYLCTLAALAACAGAHAAPRLGPAWSDHMVIQRDQPVLVEGTAAAGETVAGQLGSEQQKAVAGADGRFVLRFAPRTVSAVPLELVVTGVPGSGTQDSSQRVSDILVGDVWLCSGQSNMELSVNNSLDSWNQKQQSADAELRLLTVAKATAAMPQAEFAQKPNWALASPETVADFSAACYYMAKELRRQRKVPVGLVHAGWGGSQIRAWLSPEAGQAIYGTADMALLALSSTDYLQAVAAFIPRWEAWYRAQSGGGTPWSHPDSVAWADVPRIGFWNNWSGTPLATQANGNVWLRRTVSLSAEQARMGAELQLGILDDMDTSWVNGHAVGNTHGWDTERKYRVPAAFLQEGPNEVMVSVNNSWGTGGFASSADKLAWVAGDTRIPLADGWRYAISPVTAIPPRAPWDANAGIGVMHNRMVAPLGHFALQGVVWYQGESDAGIPGYQGRLRALVEGWRAQFGAGARMLVVQLANYGAPALAPAESGWADVREAQRKAVVADKNAALVTAIDLGDRTDIHPANKNELGRRLALAAVAEALPQPIATTRQGRRIRVKFSGVVGGLHAWSASHPLALELCGATPASCRYVEALIDGDSLVIAESSKSNTPATRVRYAWADSPVVNLYDGRKLPVPAFELPITAGKGPGK